MIYRKRLRCFLLKKDLFFLWFVNIILSLQTIRNCQLGFAKRLVFQVIESRQSTSISMENNKRLSCN